MRLTLKPIELRMNAVADLKLGDGATFKSVAAEIASLRSVKTVRFFGTGEKLRELRGVDQVATSFAKKGSGLYRFADSADMQGDASRTVWEVEITRGLVSVLGVVEGEPKEIKGYIDELPILNRTLLAHRGGASLHLPISSANAPDVQVDAGPMPRFGAFSPTAIADVIVRHESADDATAKIVEQLTRGPLPDGASRRQQLDQLVISWGDIEKEAPERIIARRDKWFINATGAEEDSADQAGGDAEYFLNATAKAAGLSGYDASKQVGAKAIADTRASELQVLLRELEMMLKKGSTTDGRPLRDIVVIVPSREQAVEVMGLGKARGLSTVVYVDEENRLRLPVPEE